MKKLRLICLFAFFVLSLTLVSCDSGGTNKTTGKNGTGPQTEEGVQTASEDSQTADGSQTASEDPQTADGSQTGTEDPQITDVAKKPVLIAEMDFSDPSLIEYPYWSNGSQLGGSLSFQNGYAEGEFPESDSAGVSYVWLSCKLWQFPEGDNLDQIFIEFDAQMPGSVKRGFKFCKVFGLDYSEDSSYSTHESNCTFGIDYVTGNFSQVNYGDGTGLFAEDTAKSIHFDGSITSNIGRSPNPEINYYGGNSWSASNWGEDWHHFRLMVKFNSGTSPENEIADGEFYVEIDGVAYLYAKNIFNRHYSSAPIRGVGFYNITQNNPGFKFNYDNIKISKNGFME